MEKQNTQISVNTTTDITELIFFSSGEWGVDFTEGVL
jgi:hypothetical protein